MSFVERNEVDVRLCDICEKIMGSGWGVVIDRAKVNTCTSCRRAWVLYDEQVENDSKDHGVFWVVCFGVYIVLISSLLSL